MNQRRGSLQLIAFACLIVGVLFPMFSVPLFWGQIRILRSWPETQAQVLRNDIVSNPSGSHGQLYSAQLQLSYPADGQWTTVEFTTGQSSNYAETARSAAQFPIGSHHPVRYDPKNPAQARIDASWSWRFFLLPLVALGVGILFVLLGAGLFRVAGWGARA
jgi:uncharacterized protein DUF3592